MDLHLLSAEPSDAEREAIDAVDPKSGTAEFKATAITVEAVA